MRKYNEYAFETWSDDEHTCSYYVNDWLKDMRKSWDNDFEIVYTKYNIVVIKDKIQTTVFILYKIYKEDK